MIWVDWCILLVVLISGLIGLFRGFTREILGLLTWALALWLAVALVGWADQALAPHIASLALRLAVAYALLFLSGLLLGGIVTALLTDAIRNSRYSSADRTLGAGVGLIRGGLLVAVFVLIAGLYGARSESWFRQSALLLRFEPLAQALQVLIPEDWLRRLQPRSLPTPTPAAPVPSTP
ncbi:MAG TPA: CvpA family protein [Nevskiaceae bacterium]|nr:CvpA family protein [Nevskiaceae bacterium]